MKAKRRHELKTNELAQSLQDVRFYLQRRGGLVLGVSVAAVLALIVGTVWNRSAAQARTDGWQSYYNISSGLQGGTERVSNALTLAENTRDPALARLALQLAAGVAWSEARPPDGPFEPDKLKQAEQAYEQLLDDYDDSVHTVGTALRGLAAIAEEWADQATGTTEREAFKAEARKHYQAIIDDDRLANSPARMVAEESLNSLDARLVPVTLIDPPATQAAETPTAEVGVPSPPAPAVPPTTPGSDTQPSATPTTAPATSAPAPTTVPAAQ